MQRKQTKKKEVHICYYIIKLVNEFVYSPLKMQQVHNMGQAVCMMRVERAVELLEAVIPEEVLQF